MYNSKKDLKIRTANNGKKQYCKDETLKKIPIETDEYRLSEEEQVWSLYGNTARYVKTWITGIAFNQKNIKFDKHLISENIKWLLTFLGIVAVSQLVLIVIEFSGVMQWDFKIFILRLIVIFICLLFVALIYFWNRTAKQKHKFKYYRWLILLFELVAYITGCYFVVSMVERGVYSFSSLLLTCFVIFLIGTRKPYFTSFTMFLFFIGLSVYINLYKVDFSIWKDEFNIAIVYLFLLSVGNVLNYRRHFKLFKLGEKLSVLNEKLEARSLIDELTGIYNRRKINDVSAGYIDMAKRYNTSFCVSILDLDHFKKVNDEYGHIVGDDVLYRFANNIRFMLRSTDVFGRWGGEEFIILTPNCCETESYKLLERLRMSIENYEFPTVGQVTFSAGISSYSGEKDINELIKKADIALYSAKEMGRNRIHVYQAEHQTNQTTQ